jgi:hypothetical protein
LQCLGKDSSLACHSLNLLCLLGLQQYANTTDEVFRLFLYDLNRAAVKFSFEFQSLCSWPSRKQRINNLAESEKSEKQADNDNNNPHIIYILLLVNLLPLKAPKTTGMYNKVIK